MLGGCFCCDCNDPCHGSSLVGSFAFRMRAMAGRNRRHSGWRYVRNYVFYGTMDGTRSLLHAKNEFVRFVCLIFLCIFCVDSAAVMAFRITFFEFDRSGHSQSVVSRLFEDCAPFFIFALTLLTAGLRVRWWTFFTFFLFRLPSLCFGSSDSRMMVWIVSNDLPASHLSLL